MTQDKDREAFEVLRNALTDGEKLPRNAAYVTGQIDRIIGHVTEAARSHYAPKLTEKEAVEKAAEGLFYERKMRVLFPLGEVWENTSEDTRTMYLAEAKAALKAAGMRFKEEA